MEWIYGDMKKAIKKTCDFDPMVFLPCGSNPQYYSQMIQMITL